MITIKLGEIEKKEQNTPIKVHEKKKSEILKAMHVFFIVRNVLNSHYIAHPICYFFSLCFFISISQKNSRIIHLCKFKSNDKKKNI